MAAADTARLVAELTLNSRGFDKGVASANKSLGSLESTIGNVGRRAGEGFKSLGKNLAVLGAVAVGGIAVAVKSGLQDLATLETAVTSVDGAIEQLGLTGQVTGQQVADWANEIERDIGAAFDDKDITAAAATLIRFGKVTPKNLQKALVVMTDLAAKTGDVESASTLLAKALADPAKAAGKLARSGVILTKAQQDTIKAMVEQNDIAGAQQLILDELAKTTGGAAAASQGKYQRAISLLNDVAEDARKALAEGFLPVIEKVANLLSTKLADPKFVQGLRDFGNTLAAGLDDLIDVALKLPWDTIGTSLQIAGAGAKTLLEAFTSLPPWVQTAVLTGWGLNKLTGGALTGIAGEIIKGMTSARGTTPANPLFVSQVGGVPGGASGVGAAGGLSASAAGAAGIGVLILGVTQAASASLAGSIATAITGNARVGGGVEALQTGLSGGSPLPVFGPIDRLIRGLQGDFRSAEQVAKDIANGTKTQVDLLGNVVSDTRRVFSGIDKFRSDAASRQNIANERLESIKRISTTEQQAAFQIRDKLNGLSPIKAGVDALKGAINATTAAARHAGQQSAAAIRDKDLSVRVNATVNVSNKVWVGETIKTQTTFKKLGGFVAS